MNAQPKYMDPRSTAGILSRGKNVYQGTSFSPKVGQGANFAPIASQQLANNKILPPNSMQNINYQQVARWLTQPSV